MTKHCVPLVLVLGLLAAPVLAAGKAPPAKGGRPPSKGAETEEESTGHAFVLEDSDAVILRDGTRIEGTILCAGAAAVTILTTEGERTVEKTIPREAIERVVKNADAGFPTKFVTVRRDGHKFLTDEEIEGADAPDDNLEEGRPAAPAPKAPPRKARPPAKPKKRPAKRPAAPRKAPPRTELPKEFKLPPGFQIPGIPMPKDPARAKALLERLRKSGMLDKLLKDPRIRKAIQEARKKR